MNDTTDSTTRRYFLRLGGLTGVTASAIALAACGKSEAGETGNIGFGETAPTLPPAVVDNGVHLRTLAGVELSIAAAYQRMIDGDMLSVPSATFRDVADLAPLVTQFAQRHVSNAAALNSLAVSEGVEPWECGNTRLDSAYIDVVFDRIENGVAATDSTLAIAPSDDPTRDVLNLVHTLETLSAASCQGTVAQVSERQLRAEIAKIGVASARQSALMALLLNPGGYVSATDADNAEATGVTTTVVENTVVTETTQDIATPATDATSDDGDGDAQALTEIPLPVAIPAQFGSLAPIVYVGGSGDENGVRLKLNFETPSFNSFAYKYETCG